MGRRAPSWVWISVLMPELRQGGGSALQLDAQRTAVPGSHTACPGALRHEAGIDHSCQICGRKAGAGLA